MLKQMQQAQAKFAQMQEEIANTITASTSGGGVVKAVVIGTSKIESIIIDPKAVDPEDIELLQDLILAAVNDAFEKAQKLANEKMGQITGGLNIPGLM